MFDIERYFSLQMIYNKVQHDKSNTIKIIISLIVVFYILLPPLIFPLYQLNLENIYRQTFPDVDASIIITTIKSAVYLYMWMDLFFFFIIRVFCFALLLKLTFYFYDEYDNISFLDISKILIYAEVVLLAGKYIIVAYNYFHLHYYPENFYFNFVPLSPLLIFINPESNRTLYLLLSKLDLFAFAYTVSLGALIFKLGGRTKGLSMLSTSFVALFWLLIEVLNPIGNLFAINMDAIK